MTYTTPCRAPRYSVRVLNLTTVAAFESIRWRILQTNRVDSTSLRTRFYRTATTAQPVVYGCTRFLPEILTYYFSPVNR